VAADVEAGSFLANEAAYRIFVQILPPAGGIVIMASLRIAFESETSWGRKATRKREHHAPTRIMGWTIAY